MTVAAIVFEILFAITTNLVPDALKRYFEVFGAVQDAVVMKDPVSHRSRGFGFITFVDPSSVDAVLAQDQHTIDSRRVISNLFAQCLYLHDRILLIG